MCRVLEEECRQAADEQREQQEESDRLSAELQQLRSQLSRETSESDKQIRHYEDRIEQERHESTRLQMKLAKAELQGSELGSDFSTVKSDVEEKTNEIVQIMREFKEQQQQALKQVKRLAHDMLRTCSQPTGSVSSAAAGPGSGAASGAGGSELLRLVGPALSQRPIGAAYGAGGSDGSGSAVSIRGPLIVNGAGFGSRPASRSPPRTPPRSPPGSVVGSIGNFAAGPLSPPASCAGSRRDGLVARSASPGGDGARSMAGDEGTKKWFQTMKANLEEFGEVEVFMDDAPRECLCCNQEISTSYRVRPRRCGHIFHVECLLRWWSEGTCPVCHASFAPESVGVDSLPLTERSSTPQARSRGGHAVPSSASWSFGGQRRQRSPTSPGSPGGFRSGTFSPTAPASPSGSGGAL